MLRDTLIRTGLSNRESEVAALVATGMSNKEVADRLFVTEKTIKFHLTNIYKKMNIRSRAQLIVWCLPHLNFSEQQNTQAQNAPMGQPINRQASPIQHQQPVQQQPAQQGYGQPQAPNVATLATGRGPIGSDSGTGNGGNGEAFGA